MEIKELRTIAWTEEFTISLHEELNSENLIIYLIRGDVKFRLARLNKEQMIGFIANRFSLNILNVFLPYLTR